VEESPSQPHSSLGDGTHQPDRLLYVGRLEPGKNLALLYEYVRRYVDAGGDLQLVIAGEGPLRPPADHPAFDWRGPVSESEKSALLSSALALCQPSANESFSLVLMESWLAGRPVLVWGPCAVTKGHVQRCQGGLWFWGYAEFAEAIRWFKANRESGRQMGANGREYVERNFRWPAIAGAFKQTLEAWRAAEKADSPRITP
jgi:glycosyltransferase involved in cell wall biosynthesis